jgi:P-type conjugative transfer protein TrbJ
VIDASNLVQSTISALYDIKTALSAAQEVINSYTQIANQVTQIANQVKNLQQFDANYAAQLVGLNTSITGTLQHARGVSFQLGQATTDFDALYPRVASNLSGPDVQQMRLQWVQQRREAAQVGIQVQSITEALRSLSTSVTRLLHQAASTQGNLDISQVQAQQTGVTQSILLQQMQIAAGNGRAAAVREAEDATLEEARVRDLEAATQPTPRYAGGRGRLSQWRW